MLLLWLLPRAPMWVWLRRCWSTPSLGRAGLLLELLLGAASCLCSCPSLYGRSWRCAAAAAAR